MKKLPTLAATSEKKTDEDIVTIFFRRKMRQRTERETTKQKYRAWSATLQHVIFSLSHTRICEIPIILTSFFTNG